MEVVIGDGTSRRFGPGDAVLFGDLAGQGHTRRSVGGDPRRRRQAPSRPAAHPLRGEPVPRGHFQDVQPRRDGGAAAGRIQPAQAPWRSGPRSWHEGLGEVIESKPKNGYSGNPVDRVTNIKILSLSATSSGTMDLSKFMYLDEDIPLDATCRAGVATSVFSAAIQKSSSEQQQFSMWMTRQSAKRAASSSCRWPDRQKDMPARSMNCRNVSEHCCGLPTTTIRPPGARR